MTKTASDYYPSNIKLEVFPNKIYFLSWEQHQSVRSKLLNKAKAFTLVNDMNVDKSLRAEVLKAFRAGVIV